VAGRNRLALTSGMWRTRGGGAIVTTGNSALDVFGGFEYTRYVREDLAVTFSSQGFGVESGVSVGRNSASTGNVGGLANLVGVRWNPFKGDHRVQSLKPFIAVGAGPVVGFSEGVFVNGDTVSTGNFSRATLGGHFGGGFDVHVARSFSLGLNAGYNATLNFSEPVGVHKNFNGAQVGLSVGWLFGKGYAASVSR
jgi:hypothetical protein